MSVERLAEMIYGAMAFCGPASVSIITVGHFMRSPFPKLPKNGILPQNQAEPKLRQLMPETPATPDCRKCQHFGDAIMPEKRCLAERHARVTQREGGKHENRRHCQSEGRNRQDHHRAALAVVLGRGGTRVHMIDMDPQASLTRAFGASDETDGLYNALASRAGLPGSSRIPNLSLTPGTIELGRAETELLPSQAGSFS